MDPLVTIGTASELSGVSTRAIRLYERRGLLRNIERSPAGYRLFGPVDLDVLDFIRRARALGLRLDEVRHVLQLQNGGVEPCPKVVDLLDQRLAEIDRRIGDLHAMRNLIQDTKNRASRPGRKAPICRLIQPEGP